MESALYQGWVRHRRTAPVENEFRYQHAMLYLDLAELPTLFEREPLVSLGRPNLAWWKRADYFGDPRLPLDEALRRKVAEETGARPTGPIRMLTQLRTMGYLFNPVTFYYCFDDAGDQVETIVAEITNTPWHERHAYVLTRAASLGEGSSLRFRFPKIFHVSPFLPMDITHDWRFAAPGEQIRVHMEDWKDGDVVLDATLALTRMPLRRHTLTASVLRHPLRTFQVTAGIYAQALRLWWKRCPFFPHPRHAPSREQGASDDRSAHPVRQRPGRDAQAASRPQAGAEPAARSHARQPVDS